MTEPAVKTMGGKVSRARYWIGVAILVALLAWGFGSFHCVRPAGGWRVIPKEEWGFYDQFIDMDDFTGQSALTIIGNGQARTARALVRAGILSFDE